MNRPMTDPVALIAALAEEARSAAGKSPDPEPEELLDYLAGRLSPEDEERIGRRLAASPEAARALLDLAELEAAGAAVEGQPPELAVMAGWRDLRSQLPAATPRSSRPPVWLSTVAATLLVSTVGLGSKVLLDRSERNRPVASATKIVEFLSRPRGEREPPIDLAPGQSLVLALGPAVRCPTYTARIAGPGERDLQTVQLERDPLGRLALNLPGLPGEYRLSLYGCDHRSELEKHSFRIKGNAR